ncbi:MAG TPA: sialidase family protein [Gaiellaceae bacterium]|nr:sialidase family protein [Gaiellaceae bacterium]
MRALAWWLAACALGLALVGSLAAAGPEVNVSRLPGLQTTATIAIHPTDGRILLAGSNSILEGTMRAYGSTDGGVTWRTTMAHRRPASVRASCSSDPGVAIDRRGQQYYSFVRATPCTSEGKFRVYVVSRSGPDAGWSTPVAVAPSPHARLDDKPAIAVDTSPVSRFRNRVYVAWSRVTRNAKFSIVLSHSNDRGRTWSQPVKVNRIGRELTFASIGIARDGSVYVAWDDVSNFGIYIARSTDGGAHFGRQRKLASFVAVSIPRCGSGIVIPAQLRSCIQANPIVAVDTSGGRYSGRVYVSYGRTEFRGLQAAHVAVFDRTLHPLLPDPSTREGRPVAPTPGGQVSDQFWAQSAVDATDGTVWVCFYDTLGDPQRRKTHFTCTSSQDGGQTWASPVQAATVASDATQPGAANHYGYYQGLAVGNGVAHPMWTDTRDLDELGEEIYTTTLTLADFKRSG